MYSMVLIFDSVRTTASIFKSAVTFPRLGRTFFVLFVCEKATPPSHTAFFHFLILHGLFPRRLPATKPFVCQWELLYRPLSKA